MNSSGTFLTWNVQRRTTLLEEQAKWVLEREPDVLCLQEVTPRALLGWSHRLKDAGYHVAASALVPHTGRRLGVLIASRLPFTCAEPLAAAPWPERLLIADVQVRAWPQTVRVVCLHAPTRGNSVEAKIRTFEAVSASLVALDDHVPAILCGDLNAPQTEASDGPSRRSVRRSKVLFAVARVHGKTEPNGRSSAARPVGMTHIVSCTATSLSSLLGRPRPDRAADSGWTTCFFPPTLRRSSARTITACALGSPITPRCTRRSSS